MEFVHRVRQRKTSPFPDIGAAKLTRLSFEKTFVFADAEAAADFKSRLATRR
jgi:hypothetical protein